MARTVLAFVVAFVLLLATIPVLVVWIPLVLFARAVRALHARLEPRATPWDELVEFDPDLGWRTAADLDTAARADSVFRFSTEGHGWRRAAPLEESDVVVLGDSFAFGFGVDDGDYFADHCLHTHDLRVTPMGTVAYNLVQEVLLLDRHGPEVAGKLVVWMLYVGNDISENLTPHLGRYRIPFLRAVPGTDHADHADHADSWEIVTSHVRSEPWPWSTGDAVEAIAHAELCCDTPTSRKAFAATHALLRRGRDVCDRHGANLVVFGIPDPFDFAVERLHALAPDPGSFDPDRPAAQLRAACDELGIAFVDLRNHLARRHYKPADNHWNESGHRRVAAVLADTARSRRRPPPSVADRERVGPAWVLA